MNKFEYEHFGEYLKYLSDEGIEEEIDRYPLQLNNKKYIYDDSDDN